MQSSSFPQLTSERLLYRQFTEADLENVYKGLSHPEVIPFYGVSFDSLEATQEQIEWFANLEKTDTGIWWAICDQATESFVGAGGLNDLSREHGKAEIGFWLLPDYWGKGYMQEGMRTILDHAFGPMGLHRIEGYVFSGNANCKKAMDRLNFQLEGTMRECEIKNGERMSVDIYARLATDYRADQ